MGPQLCYVNKPFYSEGLFLPFIDFNLVIE